MYLKQITESVFAPLNALEHLVEWGIYFPRLSSLEDCPLSRLETSQARYSATVRLKSFSVGRVSIGADLFQSPPF